MSYFGNALQALLNRKRMKAVRLAELSGVAQSTVSRLVNGDQPSPSPEDYDAICHAVSGDPADHAELLKAHLLDECRGPGSERIAISVSGKALREISTPYQVNLPDNLERCLTVIREHVIKDKNVREIVEGIGNLLLDGDCRTNEELANSSDSVSDEDIIHHLEDDTGDPAAKGKKHSSGRKKP